MSSEISKDRAGTSRARWEDIEKKVASGHNAREAFDEELEELRSRPLLERGLQYWKDRILLKMARILLPDRWIKNDPVLQQQDLAASWDEAIARDQRYNDVKSKIDIAQNPEDLEAAIKDFEVVGGS
ncbi:MAG: hypothetical protein A3J48_00805 [Candidatus Doudnabacteria bacterium RIFCSPHIGHO2_02_FULL_46_11]|uniref:Uncharacterized protein n=1 Tax=Candidatus Doudnabacteria bacterium RIFCSPHIGHO2_02_FULL_46_11 TaxID=1817832 RepID=A0A1F5P941_9BACT|nr:MAG: hypothetical protein A3J48_00805 [Candidatus Doudnabacteria bacterium RIFCSPHIGHO2_02_FULL_46_11]